MAQFRVSKPFVRTTFNTASLNDLCPVKIQEDPVKGVWFPNERLVLVEGFLRRIGCPLFISGNEMEFIPHDDPQTLKKLLKHEIQELFNYDIWYCGMKGLRVMDKDGITYDPMATAFIVPLLTEQVQELFNLASKIQPNYKHSVSKHSLSDEEQLIYDKYVDWFEDKMVEFDKMKQLSNEYNNIHDESFEDIDETRNECYQEGYFVRLSGRSPKDFIAQLVTSSKTGNDVVNRLVHSSRSSFCFKEYLNSIDPGKSISAIFIPWDNNLNSSLEFRCFVHHHKLTAISQYDCYHTFTKFGNMNLCYFIKKLIEDFYQQLKPFIPFHSCIMDVVLKPKIDMKGEFIFAVDVEEDSPDWRVHLLEFNPFYADVSSGAGLFDWEQDLPLLYNGHADGTVLRVRVKPPLINGQSQFDRPKRPFVVDLV